MHACMHACMYVPYVCMHACTCIDGTYQSVSVQYMCIYVLVHTEDITRRNAGGGVSAEHEDE